jgi:Excalibur calcium-binding domain
MHKRLISSLTALVLATPAGIALTASSADAASLDYSSCSKLTVKFHHGVAKSRTAATRQVRQGYGVPAYGSLAQKVYWKNYKRLDRDRDGTACER